MNGTNNLPTIGDLISTQIEGLTTDFGSPAQQVMQDARAFPELFGIDAESLKMAPANQVAANLASQFPELTPSEIADVVERHAEKRFFPNSPELVPIFGATNQLTNPETDELLLDEIRDAARDKNSQVGGSEGATQPGDEGDGTRGDGGGAADDGGAVGDGGDGQTGGAEGATQSGDEGDGTRGGPKGDPGGSGAGSDLGGGSPFTSPPTSPLVIDLDGDGIELTALDGSNTYFDLNVDGFAERTGWVNPDDGLLALDVNGNGRIDDNSELFGNATGFNDGFAQLAELDSNDDGVIDANDAAYGDLRIWRDLDQDGVSDEGELQGLNEVGIASIDLNATEVSETNLEHLVSHRSSVTFSDGTTGLIEDIHFQNDLSNSIALLPDDFEYHPDAIAMPVLFGYGKITSTWVSLSADEGLRAQASDLLGHLASADISAFRDGFEGFVQDWAGVADVDPTSRGPNVDARKLAFLEKAYGTTFIDQYGGSDPRPNAGRELGEFYDDLVQKLAGRFMAQSA